MKNSANLKAANPDTAKEKSNHGRNAKEFSKMNNLTRTNVKCSAEPKHMFKTMTFNTDSVLSQVKEEQGSGGESRPAPLVSVTENAAAGKEGNEKLNKPLNKHFR